jgi:glycyl-tRNA synthetase
MAAQHLDDIISLCKRRGFLFPSGSLYGGIQGVYDYGPLGVELKNALKATWWCTNVHQREDIVGLDSAILSHAKVFHYSGHEATFADLLVDCRQCQHRSRADHVIDHRCEHCGSNDLTDPRPFNLMFKTNWGVGSKDGQYAYLRPETAQGIFTNFKQVIDSHPRALPFGIAQIGKAFRNEITPRHFIFRVREFEQMEIEFFVKPGEDESWYQQWIEWRYQWWVQQGLAPERLRKVAQSQAELAHYAKATTDIQYQFPHGFEELEGIANRTDYDLGAHTKEQASLNLSATVPLNTQSTQKLAIFDRTDQKWIVPYVIEPSAGLDRGILAILTEAYHQEPVDQKERIVLKLKPHLAPIKVAVIPLARNNARLLETARYVKQHIQKLSLGMIAFEDSGNIGKSYRRHDEIGTPLCITVDFESLLDDTASPSLQTAVTVRERDSMQQVRFTLTELLPYLRRYFNYESSLT